MKDTIQKDLNTFIKHHIHYQLAAFALSNRANHIGFSGFGHFYQVESADAFVHTRRIMNYMMMTDVQYHVVTPDLTKEIAHYNTLDIVALMEVLLDIKINLLNLTNKLSDNARKAMDYGTARFYEWYLIDLTQEIDYNRDLRDYMKYDKTQIVNLERKFHDREEPDVNTVQKPFTINEQ